MTILPKQQNSLRYYAGLASLFVLLAVILFWPSSMVRAQGGHNITLNWTAPTAGGAPTSYNVKRGTAAGAETQLASVTVPATTYVDSAGVGGTKYFYVVTAVNSGGESVPSNEVSATFLVSVPGSPSGLAAVSN